MKKSTLFLIGMIIVAFNLRPALTGVGPITIFIQNDLGISAGTIGLLAMLPLLAFGFMSLGAPTLGASIGNSRAILYGLILLLFGIIVRSIGGISLLYFGTLFIGIGISIGNVLLPSFVKEKFAEKSTMLIGVYSAVLSFGAAIGSGMTAPIALQNDWRIALAVSGLFVFIALLIWVPVAIKDRKASLHSHKKRPIFPFKQSIAWYVTIFMGVQSLLFYSLVNWLPSMLEDRGVSVATAGVIVMVMQLASLPAILFIPFLANRSEQQKGLALSIASLYFIGLVGLFFLPASLFFLYISASIVGLAQGGSICLALLLVSLRAKTPSQVMVLSGMAQSFGYFIAALGPVAFGILRDITHTWVYVIVCLLSFTIILAITGWKAGQNRFINEEG